MNLRESLQAAVADAPPTGIDLDQLSQKERRHRFNRRWAVAGAGLAVLALTIAAIPLLSPSASPQPAANPDLSVKVVPTGAPPVENDTSRRLTTVLAQLDPAFQVPPGTKFGFHKDGWGAAPEGWYSAEWVAGTTKLVISVFKAPIPQEEACVKSDCVRSEEPDGSVSYTAEESGAQPKRQAEHYRRNNTAVMVGATGVGVTPDFTTEQLLVAAKLPGWDL